MRDGKGKGRFAKDKGKSKIIRVSFGRRCPFVDIGSSFDERDERTEPSEKDTLNLSKTKNDESAKKSSWKQKYRLPTYRELPRFHGQQR